MHPLFCSLAVLSLCLFQFHTSPGHSQPPKTIMAIFAHPDDETIVSPLLSKYAREGHKVYLVFATNGEKGIREHAAIPAGDSLAVKRMDEARCLCHKINIQPPVFLNLHDGELGADFTGEPLHKKIDSIYRIYKPDVVITWGPDGGYGHVDHRMVHNIVTELYQSGLLAYPKSLFYPGTATFNWQHKPELKTQTGNFFYQYWKPVKNEFLSVRVKCSKEDREKGLEGLRCHWSQFTSEEMEDIRQLLLQMNKNDTVYLRPFINRAKISYRLID